MRPASARRQVILGIGVSNYSWDPLPNANSDVQSVCDSFQSRGYHPEVLLDVPTVEEMDKFLERVQREAVHEGTEVLCGYLAVHAVETTEGLVRLLCKYSTSEKDMHNDRGFFLDDLCDKLLRFPVSETADIYLFLDCCRNRLSISSMHKSGHLKLKQRQHLSRGVQIMFSCASNQPAWDGEGQHSPFATNLIRLVNEGVDWSFQALYNELQPAVSSHTRSSTRGLIAQQITLTQSTRASHTLFSCDQPSQNLAQLVGVPAANESFTGRAEELDKVEATFENQCSMCAIVQTRAITGLGGIGKTQLAKAFVYQHRKEYDVVLGLMLKGIWQRASGVALRYWWKPVLS